MCALCVLDFIYFDTLERKHSFIAYIFAFKEKMVPITPVLWKVKVEKM